MRALRRWVAATALAASVCAVPAAHAETMPHLLTITGTHSSYAVLTVTRTARYTLGQGAGVLAGVGSHDEPKVDYLTDGGQYGGFAIGTDTATLWTVHHPDSPTLLGHPWGKPVLKPGRYKVYLFAESGHRVTVTVPWTGPDLTLHTDAPVDAKVSAVDAPVPGLTQPVVLTLPQDGRRHANTDAALILRAVVDPTVSLRLCLTRSAVSCDRSWRVLRGSGSAVNGWATGLGYYNSEKPTQGLYIHGEVGGVNAGVATLVVLRYYR